MNIIIPCTSIDTELSAFAYVIVHFPLTPNLSFQKNCWDEVGDNNDKFVGFCGRN